MIAAVVNECVESEVNAQSCTLCSRTEEESESTSSASEGALL